MRRDESSPKAYRNDVDGKLRPILEIVRDVIVAVDPEIEEDIGHGMLDYPGLANLAAQKNYVALYVAPTVLDRFKDDFPGVSRGKSCLRFTRIEQVDRDVLAKLLREVRAFRTGAR
jgi:uncharacterized protein YdhG (YjbR/CyaY superfamily)